MITLRYIAIYSPVFACLWLGLFLDSTWLANRFEYNQWLTNVVVLLCFIWVYSQVRPRVKKLMIYGVLLALVGEVVFSIVLGMYEYRLANVPLYVPLGHSLVYAAVFYLHKEEAIQQHKQAIVTVLYWAMLVYSSAWLVVDGDVFGFICTLVIVFLFYKKSVDPLFFLIMFFMVVYLELLGTYYQCWLWPDTWFDIITFIPSSNPPSGISVFYFGFDIGCLWIYKKCNARMWQRLQMVRRRDVIKN